MSATPSLPSTPASAQEQAGGDVDQVVLEIEGLLAASPTETNAQHLYAAALKLYEFSRLEHAPLLAQAMLVAAQAGVADAWIDVGRCRWHGWGLPEDHDAALADYLRGADEGSVEGAFAAAHNLYFNFERYDEAWRYVSLALERGDYNGRARFLAGLMAWHGRGREASRADAVQCYHEAAGEGNPDAMFELSALYARGDGVPQDPVRALVWCRRAAERGQLRACYNMGAFHATGAHGASQDWTEAVKWYGLASDGGHEKASYTLGVMYLYGQGVEQDLERSRYFLRRAAEQGLSPEEAADAFEELETMEEPGG